MKEEEKPAETLLEDQNTEEAIESATADDKVDVTEDAEARPTEPVRSNESAIPGEKKEPAESRGFFGRIFGKGSDY